MAMAGVAAADEPGDERWAMFQRTPGAPNDPLTPFLDRYLAVRTPAGFALEGDEAPLLLDGYRIPMRQGDGTPAVTSPGIAALWLQNGGDAMFGENNALALISGPSPRGGELSTREVAAFARTFTLRLDTLGLVVPHFIPADRELAFGSAPTSFAFQGHASARASAHLSVVGSALVSTGGLTYYTDRTEHPDQRVHRSQLAERATIEEHYQNGAWRADLSQSFGEVRIETERGTAQHDDRHIYDFETRDQVQHELTGVAGVAKLTWLLGGEAHVRRYDLSYLGGPEAVENVARVIATPFDDTSHAYDGIVWTSDIAGSTGVIAQLAPRVRAYLALRLDAFGTELALQPRGEIAADLGDHYLAALTAGAYRRAPDRGEEIEHAGLHPERTSRIAFELARNRATTERGFAGSVRAYYDDRTNLIERDGLGAFANTGNGTTYGASALVSEHLGHWFAQLAITLEHADRQNTYRTRVRPYEYDQPVRLDAVVQHRYRQWLFGAHWALREGLPYTPITSATFDSDRDVYLPLFAIQLYSARLPWQHQLDLRIDRELTAGRVKLTAYLDIANAYDQRNTIGWAYNFNYTQQRAIESLPILPTLGIRGEL